MFDALSRPLYFPKGNSSHKESHRIKFQRKGDRAASQLSLAEFEDISDMTYVSELAFRSKGSYERVRRLTLKAVETQKISQRALWLGDHFGDLLDAGYVHDVAVRWVDRHMEYGLFTETPVHKHAFIGEYTGLIRPCTLFTGEVNEYCFRYPLYSPLLVVYTIDAKMWGNEISFMNHSNHPNCEAAVAFHGDLFHMCLRALRNIDKGEQLLFDYGNEKWSQS